MWLQPREILACRHGLTCTWLSQGWSYSFVRPTCSSLANQALSLHALSDVCASTGQIHGFCILSTFSDHFSMEFLEHRQRVAFVGHKVYCTQSRVIIHKSHHVLLPGVGGYLHRATYIQMHLLQLSAQANSPRGFSLCLVAFPCTQPSQKLRGSTFFRSTPETLHLTSFSRTLSLTCANL